MASQLQGISVGGAGVDLSPRYFSTSTVVASPAAAAQTIIASLTVTGALVQGAGIELIAWVAYTVGTNGVSGDFRIRRTDTSGTIIADSGATTKTAANLTEQHLIGLDTGVTLPGQVYVATLQVASGSAASTVSAVFLRALVI